MTFGGFLSKSLSPFYHFTNWFKRKRHPQYNRTVRELLLFAGVDVDNVSAQVEERLGWNVSHICTVGYRFYKNCICVQYFDDTEKEMKWAASNGAIILVTKQQFNDLPCVVVDNPLKTYARLCYFFRNLSNSPATAVVGSIGKTTTKDMIRSVYSTSFKTFAEPTNDNLTCAVGFYSQHIAPRNQIVLQEVSEDKPGGIAIASEILRPHIAVITAVDQSHIMEYGSIESITYDICSICKFMTEKDYVIINSDCMDLGLFRQYICRVITVSTTNPLADFYADSISIKETGLQFSIHDKAEGTISSIELQNIYAKHNVICALYAYAAGRLSGVSVDRVLKGLKSFKTHGIRQNLFRVNDIIVYADCYNAVAKSISSAIEACEQIPIQSHIDKCRVAVIGDVEEAGDMSDETHRSIISSLLNSSFGVVFLYGPKLQKAYNSFPKEQVSQKDIRSYTDMMKMNLALKKTISNNSLVLFKSSRKSRLERCIKAIWPRAYYKQMSYNSVRQAIWRLKMMVE